MPGFTVFKILGILADRKPEFSKIMVAFAGYDPALTHKRCAAPRLKLKTLTCKIFRNGETPFLRLSDSRITGTTFFCGTAIFQKRTDRYLEYNTFILYFKAVFCIFLHFLSFFCKLFSGK
jgi:hypothetical protein